MWWATLARMLAITLLLAGCSLGPAIPVATPSPPIPTEVEPLERFTPTMRGKRDGEKTRRPLSLPTIEPGAPCPTSAVTEIPGGYSALGDGPIVPLLSEPVIRLDETMPLDEWYLLKTVWANGPDDTGPAVIRGRQLDGSGEVRFLTTAPVEELPVPAGTGPTNPDFPPGWRLFPATLLLPGPGCYGLQVDGSDFSHTVVLQVTE